MKKHIALISFCAALALAGCSSTSSNTTAESTNAQPAWQANPDSSEFQANPMPSYTPPAQPAYTPPSYTPPVNSADYNQTTSGNSESLGNCQIIRDANGTPQYQQMTKGCYTNETYTVGSQDTLYFISFLAGKTANEIANLNGINPAAKLKIGQVLRVK